MAKKSQETALEHWGSEELLGMAPMAQKPQGEDAASSQEAANEVPSVEVGSVGGTGEEAPEEAFNELKEPVSEVSGETMAGEMLADKVDEPRVSGDKKSKSKWPWILVLVLVLAVAGAAMWYFWDHRGSEDDEKIEPGTGMDAEVEAGVGSGKDENDALEIEEVSLDDPEIVGLLQDFRFGVSIDNPFVMDGGSVRGGFYGADSPVLAGEMPELWKLAIAISNAGLNASMSHVQETCKVNEDITTMAGTFVVGEMAPCVSEEEVQRYAMEIFGERIDLENFDFDENYEVFQGRKVFAKTGGLLEYSEANGGFFEIAVRGSGPGYILKEYAVTKDHNNIYIYTVVVRGFEQGCGVVWDDESIPFTKCKIYDVNGGVVESVGEFDTYEGAMGALLEYKDQLDRFKWTFRKNVEGNYVFESLERVE